MFDTFNFLNRWLISLTVVLATYNSSGYSYYHWLVRPIDGDLPLKVTVGVLLLFLIAVLCQAAWRSMGAIGIGINVMFLTACVWILVDYGIIDMGDPGAAANATAFIIGSTLGWGTSWSHQRTRLCGQVDAKDVNQY